MVATKSREHNREQHLCSKAASRVARAILSAERERELKRAPDHMTHIRTRMGTLHILLDEEIERFQKSSARASALALILAADFCWQALRALAGQSGDDREWMKEALPLDWRQSEQDVGDDFYTRQQRIVENARWIFDLHSALRHPKDKNPDLIALLREPVQQDVGQKLLRAAKEISQVWIAVQGRLGATGA